MEPTPTPTPTTTTIYCPLCDTEDESGEVWLMNGKQMRVIIQPHLICPVEPAEA